uniref:Uncharacterized protein n=1 Tax=Populus trichocarpa TaxID=3694 RepID=U5FIH1_POPTR
MLSVQRQLLFREKDVQNNMRSRHYTPTLQMSQHSIAYPSYKHGYLHQSFSKSQSSCSHALHHKKLRHDVHEITNPNSYTSFPPSERVYFVIEWCYTLISLRNVSLLKLI